MKKQLMIYLSSPYTKGNRYLNFAVHMFKWYQLTLKYRGKAVFIAPLVFHAVQELLHQKLLTESHYLEYDKGVIAHCDAIFAFDGFDQSYLNSYGVGEELREAAIHNLEMFVSEQAMDTWINSL